MLQEEDVDERQPITNTLGPVEIIATIYEAISKFISRTDVDCNGSPLMFYVHVYIGVEPFFMFPVMLTRHVY